MTRKKDIKPSPIKDMPPENIQQGNRRSGQVEADTLTYLECPEDIRRHVTRKVDELNNLDPDFDENMINEGFIDCRIGRTTTEIMLEYLERDYGRKYGLYLRDDGVLFCFGLPTLAHESVPGYIIGSIMMQLGGRGFSPRDGYPCASPTCLMGRSVKEPDMCFMPFSRDLTTLTCDSDGSSFPSLVMESTYTYQSYDMLIEMMNLWLSSYTDVAMFIGTKIFAERRSKKRRFIIIWKKRTDSEHFKAELLLDKSSNNVELIEGPSYIEISLSDVLFNKSSIDLSSFDSTEPFKISVVKIGQVALNALKFRNGM